MTIEEKLKELILSKYGTVKDFANLTDLPYGTVDTILRRGIHKASVTNIIKICQTLGISTDELAKEKIVSIDKKTINRSHMTEMLDIVVYARRNINDFCDLTIDGKQMSKSEIEMLIDAVDVTVRFIKRNRERIEA